MVRAVDMAGQMASRRALELLESLLDEEQREDLRSHSGFRVRTPDCLYWIPVEGKPSRVVLRTLELQRLCIAPDRRGGMPSADLAITYLVWIRSSPGEFSRRTGIDSSNHIGVGDWAEDELVGILAREAVAARPRRPRVRARRPPRRRERPAAPDLGWLRERRFEPAPVGPTAEEWVVIAHRMREIRVRSKARHLREWVGDSMGEDVLAGLAARLLAGSR